MGTMDRKLAWWSLLVFAGLVLAAGIAYEANGSSGPSTSDPMAATTGNTDVAASTDSTAPSIAGPAAVELAANDEPRAARFEDEHGGGDDEHADHDAEDEDD